MKGKVNTTIRLDSALRSRLEEIARIEGRSLSNLIGIFLESEAAAYAERNGLIYDPERGEFSRPR